MKLKMILSAMMIVLQFFVLSCQSSGEKRTIARADDEYTGKPHPAAYISDYFMIDQDMPSHPRDPNAQFYFKRCSYDKRNAFSTKFESVCNDP